VADSTRCIAIVGAGFCGTITAVNLLRQPHTGPLRILLIDREPHARGVAYAAHPFPYLLNVPASRMSALSSDPLHFLRYAQQTMPAVTAEDFLPRAVYGDYLEEVLLSAQREAAPHVRLERVTGTVSSIQIWRPGHTFILGFAGGHEITATEVVLAMGNPPPAEIPGTDALRESTRLIENPWTAQPAVEGDESVLVIGTGLTMADVVGAIQQLGRGPARVHAISRHGLLPPRQTAFRHSHSEFDPLPLLRAASVSTRQLFRLVRQYSREAQDRGGDWREAITFVRTLVPRLWAKLPVRERRRFVRHARAYWDIHRHRLPPSVRSAIDTLRDAQRLTVHAGRILRLEPVGDQVRVTWRPRGQDETAVLLVDRVVNCTGPDYRCRSSRDPLIGNLVANGLIQPDELDTGLRTVSTGRVLNLMGHATRGLYYVGPMLRADHWEATAVQELREHAERLARQLALQTETDGGGGEIRTHGGR
jgi:uncharacterized NAD(P)/FAD-binding protein YdhS